MSEKMGFLVRVKNEERELSNRIHSLRCFSVSLEFMDLMEVERAMLLDQCRAMEQYRGLLQKRIEFYEARVAQ